MDNWYILLGLKADEVRKAMTELLGSYSQEFLIDASASIQYNKTENQNFFTPADVEHQHKRLTIKGCEKYFQNKLEKNYSVASFRTPESRINKYGHLIIRQELVYKADTKRWIENYQYDLKKHDGAIIEVSPGKSFSMLLFGKTLTFVFTEKSEKNGVILRKIMKFANKHNSLWNQIKYLTWQVNDKKIAFEDSIQ